MGFIYWIDAAPNPWVRAIAIVIIGGYYYFYADDAIDQSQWIGHWGVCWIDPDNPDGNPRFVGGKPDKDVQLIRSLVRVNGPVAGIVAFREAKRVQRGKPMTDKAFQKVMLKAFPPQKKLSKSARKS